MDILCAWKNTHMHKILTLMEIQPPESTFKEKGLLEKEQGFQKTQLASKMQFILVVRSWSNHL
jgi:hypothetical protein